MTESEKVAVAHLEAYLLECQPTERRELLLQLAAQAGIDCWIEKPGGTPLEQLQTLKESILGSFKKLALKDPELAQVQFSIFRDELTHFLYGKSR